MERLCDGGQRLQTEEPESSFTHAERVIYSNQYAVVPFGGQGSPQPDLVISVVRGDKGDHLLHVQSLACLVVTLQLLRQLGLEDYPELFTERGSRGACLLLEPLKQLK